MFAIDWNNPETLWLNLTNLGLGVVTLICLAVVTWGIAVDVRARLRRRSVVADHEVRELLASFDDHALHVPELGLTMADGGEKIEPTQAKPRRKK